MLFRSATPSLAFCTVYFTYLCLTQDAMASTSPDRPKVSFITYCIPPLAVVLLVAATRQNAPIRLATWLGYIYIAVNVCQYTTTGGGAVTDYALGTWFGTNCFMTWWLLFYTDLEEIRHKNDKIPLVQRPLLSRLFWLLCVWLGQRGVGWSVEVRAY